MIGIISAFGASLSWTYACFIWRSKTNKFKAIDINLLKNLFAFLVFLPALINFNFLIQSKYILVLLVSGILGIGLGDTFYLKSLKIIGTRKTLSIEALSPLIAAFSGDFFISEELSIRSWLGILLVTLSLVSILKKQNSLIDEDFVYVEQKSKLSDYLYSFLSIICAVFAAILSRWVFLEIEISPFITTEIRLIGAIIFLLVIKKFELNFFINKLKKRERINFIVSILLGTNIGILLQQIVFKTLPISIGWTILSTSPIISLFFANKEEGKISRGIVFLTISLFFGLTLIIS